MISIADILKKGHAVLLAKEDAAEVTKVGTLRGGNSGCYTGGEVYGKCARLSLARYLGFGFGHDSDRALMFQAGRTNEDSWFEVLSAGWDGPILREEEIPIVWTTSQGIKVTGRPDMVLCEWCAWDDPGALQWGGSYVKPQLAIELKLVSSFWTMVGVLTSKEPKVDHVVQASHYSWQLGVPVELWYTSRVDWAISGWTIKFFKVLAALISSVFGTPVEFGEKGPKKVLPFYQGFKLAVDDDRIYYQPIGTDTWRATALTQSGIKDYYELVGNMATNKDVGPRPSAKKVDGTVQEGWHPCEPKYCPLSATCDRHERNYDDWVTEVKQVSEKK